MSNSQKVDQKVRIKLRKKKTPIILNAEDLPIVFMYNGKEYKIQVTPGNGLQMT